MAGTNTCLVWWQCLRLSWARHSHILPNTVVRAVVSAPYTSPAEYQLTGAPWTLCTFIHAPVLTSPGSLPDTEPHSRQPFRKAASACGFFLLVASVCMCHWILFRSLQIISGEQRSHSWTENPCIRTWMIPSCSRYYYQSKPVLSNAAAANHVRTSLHENWNPVLWSEGQHFVCSTVTGAQGQGVLPPLGNVPSAAGRKANALKRNTQMPTTHSPLLLILFTAVNGPI